MFVYLFIFLHEIATSYFSVTPAYHIAGNFREVQIFAIFAIFATHDQNAKIGTAKYELRKFERELLHAHLDSWKFSHVRFVRYSVASIADIF